MGEHIVTTTTGKIKGYERNGGIEYLGIPYAKPPVGKLRFKRRCRWNRGKACWMRKGMARYPSRPMRLSIRERSLEAKTV